MLRNIFLKDNLNCVPPLNPFFSLHWSHTMKSQTKTLVLPDNRGNLFVNLVIALAFLTIGYGIFKMEFDLYVPTESQGAETITAGIRG